MSDIYWSSIALRKLSIMEMPSFMQGLSGNAPVNYNGDWGAKHQTNLKDSGQSIPVGGLAYNIAAP